MQNNVMKYITSMGQNTGILKQSNTVHIIAMTVDFITEYQNLNSGNLLINGLNSSLDLVGNSGPSPSANKLLLNRYFENNSDIFHDSIHIKRLHLNLEFDNEGVDEALNTHRQNPLLDRS